MQHLKKAELSGEDADREVRESVEMRSLASLIES